MQNMVGPGGGNCSVDGTVSGANPLGRVVDQFLTMGSGGAQGRMGSATQQQRGGGLRNGMNSGFNQAQQRAQMSRGPQMGGGGGGGQMDEIWMAQQQRGGRGRPPPPQARMQQRNRGGDWAAQAAAAAAHGQGMDAAFAAAQAGGRNAMPRSQGPHMMRGGMMVRLFGLFGLYSLLFSKLPQQNNFNVCFALCSSFFLVFGVGSRVDRWDR